MKHRWLAIVVVCQMAQATRAESPPAPTPEIEVVGEAWPEADAMFHRDPRWLGGDGAWSVDLGDERILWLFADSFASNRPLPGRRGAAFIHNTVAIQTGDDPTTAKFEAAWESVDGKPHSFFADDGPRWYWPGDGELVDGRLVVFLVRFERTDHGMGFAVVDWTAVVIDNPNDPPGCWKPRKLVVPESTWDVIVGFGSVLAEGDHLYAFGFRKTPAHPRYVVRWPLTALTAGDLSKPRWWSAADKDWIVHDDLEQPPAPTTLGGQTEYTVHREPGSGRWLHIQTGFFPIGPLSMRTAAALSGPWSAPINFYEPPEVKAPREGFYMYSAKAHPEQAAGDGALAVTYCTNLFKLGDLIEDSSVYYPRFVRVRIK